MGSYLHKRTKQTAIVNNTFRIVAGYLSGAATLRIYSALVVRRYTAFSINAREAQMVCRLLCCKLSRGCIIRVNSCYFFWRVPNIRDAMQETHTLTKLLDARGGEKIGVCQCH
mmetsp:Transcript_43685/g.72606  ORF Transcript_43685/g.72606 Transcript_43685/m.72606 type:complete len:113 (+) Transcript_43685:108-446(+)